MVLPTENNSGSRFGQPYVHTKSGYFDRTARPVYALVYLLPFILVYELLVLIANPDLLDQSLVAVRGGVVAFVWVQNFLSYIGLSVRLAWLCTPLVVVVILFTMQTVSRQKWKVFAFDFLPMTIECVLLAIPLLVLALLLNRPPASQQSACHTDSPHITQNHAITVPASSTPSTAVESRTQSPATTAYPVNHLAVDIITGIGAGIYEELIFRLVLISLMMLFFKTIIGLPRSTSILTSVILSALLFSLHHHVVFINGHITTAEAFTLSRFVFRSVAGVYFAALFAARGFGVTAATHAFYDIMAAILNALVFAQN